MDADDPAEVAKASQAYDAINDHLVEIQNIKNSTRTAKARQKALSDIVNSFDSAIIKYKEFRRYIERLRKILTTVDKKSNEFLLHKQIIERLAIMIDLFMATMKGMLDNPEIFSVGFDAVDDIEFTAWMQKYGAKDWAVYSDLFTACYDYAFAYQQPAAGSSGRGKRNVGAGTALRGLFRLVFTYEGHFFTKCNLVWATPSLHPITRY